MQLSKREPTQGFARAIACVQSRTNMKFVCPVCGYVEEFDGEELPADFKCPQCGVSGDRFTKVEEGKMTECDIMQLSKREPTQGFARAIACVQRRTNMKFVCPVCGYVEEFDGEELPADFKCPQCGVSGDRFTKVEEGKMTWAAEHIVGVAHEEGVSEDIIADLRANFEGECSEVGMYLAMARVAHREGYPEIGL